MRCLLILIICSMFASVGCTNAQESAPVSIVVTADIQPSEGLLTGSSALWPWWRGPGRDNIAPADQDPPTKWSESENILWRIDLPGAGHATPCMLDNAFLLPTGDKEKETISILCYSRETGRPVWKTEVHQGEFPKLHKDNSYASATIACDGELAFFPYQTIDEVRLVAVDLAGNIKWDKRVGHCTMYHGYSASPALYGDKVIVATGSREEPKMAAFDRKTGETIWSVDTSDSNESYASPLVLNVAGRDQLLLIGPVKTRGYDPANGELLWECDGPAEYNSATPVASADTVFACGGYPQRSLLAVKADGSGDVTESRRVWHLDAKRPRMGYVPTHLYHDGLLYGMTDEGDMHCFDAETGEIYWTHRTNADFYSSPVLVGDRLYVFDREGKGYIFRTGKTLELIAENELAAGAFATPVILDGKIYLRSLDDFYCIGKSE